jgi:hypothetical protein
MRASSAFDKGCIVVGVLLLTASFVLMPIGVRTALADGPYMQENCLYLSNGCDDTDNKCSEDNTTFCTVGACNTSGTPAECVAGCTCRRTLGQCVCFEE